MQCRPSSDPGAITSGPRPTKPRTNWFGPAALPPDGEAGARPGANWCGVGRMFDRIVRTYSLLNHILSFGRDFSWRRTLADALDKDRELKVLDMATGAGDLLVSLLRRNPNIAQAVGLDISENMLAACRRKIAAYKFAGRVTLMHADAACTGLPDESFDVVTMGFGIRNTPDVFKTLTEIHRVLKPSGTAFILEFSLPPNRILRRIYLVYLRYFVPLVGCLISRDRTAYRYLNKTIESFCRIEDFCDLMRKAGFSGVRAEPLTFGVVSLYKGAKL